MASFPCTPTEDSSTVRRC